MRRRGCPKRSIARERLAGIGYRPTFRAGPEHHQRDVQETRIPAARQIRLAALHERYAKLADEGFGEREIALRTNTHPGTVHDWRECRDHGLPHTRKNFHKVQALEAAAASQTGISGRNPD